MSSAVDRLIVVDLSFVAENERRVSETQRADAEDTQP